MSELYNNTIIETPEYQQFLHISQYFYGTKDYYNLFYANNYPIAYKKILSEGDENTPPEVKFFYIYPVPLSLYEAFGGILQAVFNLDEEKMQGKDPRTIKLSYLDFLVYKSSQDKDGDVLLILLFEALSQCLHLTSDQIKLDIIDGQLKLFLDGVEISHQEFNEIRNIILDQNNIEKVDLSIHPSLRKVLRDAEEFKRKHARHKMCSLEELKYRVMGKAGLSFNEINNLSVRQFTKLVESLEAISSYELNMILAPNMEKKDQQNIVHWLASVDKKKNAIEDNSISLDEMKNKLQA